MRQPEDAERIRVIHDRLLENNFDEILPVIAIEDKRIIVQAWQEGSRAADFSLQSDRTDALHLLMKLHATNDKINWEEIGIFPKARSILKWQLRLYKFQQEMTSLSYYLPRKVLHQLEIYGEKALQDIQKAESQIRKRAQTLLHGDVVHHNFLICQDGRMCLIDFDLAQIGEADDELILWLHRVLPNIHYSLPKIMLEQEGLQTIQKEKLHRLKYPNELLREWLYVLTLDKENRESFLAYLLPFTDTALTFWPELWYHSERFAVN